MRYLYDEVCLQTSRGVAQRYSTSFSLGTRLLGPKIRPAIYGIYGFVRLADEIVDTFHEQDQAELLTRFREETHEAIDRGFSLNPILQSFQLIVNQYDLRREFIDAFFNSMAMDLEQAAYDRAGYSTYIYGSAEVVGLMCLQVFCGGDTQFFEELRAPARSLGSAFQKVNFLRDMQADYNHLGRTYFPNVDFDRFSQDDKLAIEADIREEFRHALRGIRRLPASSRLGVYAAYLYYWALFKKIQRSAPQELQQKRIRIPNRYKLLLTTESIVRHKLNRL
jgi:phytoene/squalene synthetase